MKRASLWLTLLIAFCVSVPMARAATSAPRLSGARGQDARRPGKLLQATRVAMASAPSAHLELLQARSSTQGSTAEGLKRIGFIDVSPLQRRSHRVTGIGSGEEDEQIASDGRLAERLNRGAWACLRAPGTRYSTLFLAMPTSGFSLVGSEVLGSIPVWHLRRVVHSNSGSIIHYYVSRQTNRLVRVIEGPLTGVSAVVDYSRYGERVNVLLPQSCSKV